MSIEWASSLAEYTAYTDFCNGGVGTTGEVNLSAANYANFFPNGSAKALRTTGADRYGILPVTARATYLTGFRVFSEQATDAARSVMCWNETGVVHGHLELLSTNVVRALRGTATLADSAPLSPGIGSAHHLEIKLTVADVGGVFQVRADGNPTPIINFSGDTRNGGTSGVINQITLGGGPAATTAGTNEVQLADLFVLNTLGSELNDFIGPVRLTRAYMTANGASGVQWNYQATGAPGANFDRVDDPINLHDGDTTTVETATAGNKDHYVAGATNFSALAASSIKAVGLDAWIRTPDGGSHTFRTAVKKGGTTVNGTTRAVTATFAEGAKDWYTADPQTAAPWASFSDISAAELIAEMVS